MIIDVHTLLTNDEAYRTTVSVSTWVKNKQRFKILGKL